MEIDQDRLRTELAELVRIDSINPAFGGPGEAEIADRVGAALASLGMEVALHHTGPGRPSVVGRLRGTGGGRSMLLYAHLDTVGVEGMEAPFSAAMRDGRMYGRGAYDMKCGLAACLAAARALVEVVEAGRPLAGDLLVVGAADEEVASLGMSEVLRHVRADAAVVTEPTHLRLCLAHKGFSWIEVETFGRAAHGSRFDEGIDANLRMGRFLARLDRLEQELRARPPHRLVGPPSLHAAVLHGGTGTSTYAAHARLEVERRTVPGETEAQVMAEVQAILDDLAAADPTFSGRARPFLTRGSFEVDAQATIVATVSAAAGEVLGHPPEVIGEPYWMDAALLAEAGVDTVVIGATGAGAHAAEEWVELESVVQLAEILARTAVRFCGGG